MTDKKLELEHQIKDTLTGFFHRVAPVGLSKLELCKEGPWTGYKNPAVYLRGSLRVACTTAYYASSSEFPIPNKLYRISEY